MQSIKETLNIVRHLIRSNKYEEAEGILLEALTINQSNVLVLGNLADLYIKMDRLDDADKNVELILKKNPDNSYALQKKGDILARKARYDEALNIFLNLFKQNRNDYYLVKRISKAYYLMNNLKKALQYANIAIDISINKGDCYYLLYQIYIKLNDLDKAKKAINKALEFDPNNKFYYSLKLSLRLNEKKLNSSSIEEIIQIADDDNPYLLKLLADRLKTEGKFREAVDAYKQLISIDENEFNKKSLAYLYYEIKEYHKAFKIFISLRDSNFKDNIFLSTIIASAKDMEDKKELTWRMVQLAEGSTQFKNLWGRIKKISKEIEDEENT